MCRLERLVERRLLRRVVVVRVVRARRGRRTSRAFVRRFRFGIMKMSRLVLTRRLVGVGILGFVSLILRLVRRSVGPNPRLRRSVRIRLRMRVIRLIGGLGTLWSIVFVFPWLVILIVVSRYFTVVIRLMRRLVLRLKRVALRVRIIVLVLRTISCVWNLVVVLWFRRFGM